MSATAQVQPQDIARLWPVSLVLAVLLVILSLVVLSFDDASLTVTSVVIGFSFFLQGLG